MLCLGGEMLSGNGASVYHPRQPQQSPLWKLLEDHFDSFERDYEQKFIKTYGYRRAVVDDVVRDYLKCGDLREGFARLLSRVLAVFQLQGALVLPELPRQKGHPVWRSATQQHPLSRSPSSICFYPAEDSAHLLQV